MLEATFHLFGIAASIAIICSFFWAINWLADQKYKEEHGE